MPRKSSRESLPSLTPEGREMQLISLAYDLAEKKIRDGTASSQVLTHFLDMGSQMIRLKSEILEAQRDLMHAKTKAIEDGARSDEMYKEAIEAFGIYTGAEPRAPFPPDGNYYGP